MSGRRLSLAMALAVLAMTLVALPSFAMNPAPRRVVAVGQMPRVPLVAVPSQMTPQPRARIATSHANGTVILMPYYGYGFGFDPFWNPYWYPGYWWYGRPFDDQQYLLQPVVPEGQALVTLHVVPSKAEVVIDRNDLGKARSFDSVRHPLWLKPGQHVVEISKAGYQALRLSFTVESGRAYDLVYGLNKGSGVDARST